MSKKTVSPDWKNINLKNALDNDLGAAIALLTLIRENEGIKTLVLDALETYRKDMIKLEAKAPQYVDPESKAYQKDLETKSK